MNYGAYGDTGHHLHFHLVPKYTDEYEWGGVFAMNPQQKFLSDEEYTALIEEIKKSICRICIFVGFYETEANRKGLPRFLFSNSLSLSYQKTTLIISFPYFLHKLCFLKHLLFSTSRFQPS